MRLRRTKTENPVARNFKQASPLEDAWQYCPAAAEERSATSWLAGSGGQRASTSQPRRSWPLLGYSWTISSSLLQRRGLFKKVICDTHLSTWPVIHRFLPWVVQWCMWWIILCIYCAWIPCFCMFFWDLFYFIWLQCMFSTYLVPTVFII